MKCVSIEILEKFCYQLNWKNFTGFEAKVVNSGFKFVYKIECFSKINGYFHFLHCHSFGFGT